MTAEQLSKLTPEEKRVAIARAAGLPVQNVQSYGLSGKLEDNWCQGYQTDKLIPFPDYLSDLNAMHEAENTLHDETFEAYTKELVNIVNLEGGWYMHATAAQRAAAFLLCQP